jgi:hypothetical protein
MADVFVNKKCDIFIKKTSENVIFLLFLQSKM